MQSVSYLGKLRRFAIFLLDLYCPFQTASNSAKMHISFLYLLCIAVGSTFSSPLGDNVVQPRGLFEQSDSYFGGVWTDCVFNNNRLCLGWRQH